MSKRRRSRRHIFIGAGVVLLVLLLTAGTGLILRHEILEIRHKEAKNILYHYSDKIKLQMKGTLNEADALARTALVNNEAATEWFERATEPLLEKEEVCFAFLFKGDTLVTSLPANEFGTLTGKELEDFSYIFTMAKVVKDAVVEGPSVMEFDPYGQEVFLFLQPIVEDNAYLGEVVVAVEKDYVLKQLGLENLYEQGYDYELWRVEPQNGAKEVIANSQEGEDFSQAEKIVFYLPTQWNLSIQPIEGWLSSAEQGWIVLVCIILALILLAFAFSASRWYVLRNTFRQMEFRDRQTGMANRKGFSARLNRWLTDGKGPVILFYFVIEGYDQAVQLMGPAKEAEFLGSIPRRLEEYIHSPFFAGRVSNGNFLVAVREKMTEQQQEMFAKGLSLELLIKFQLEEQKIFLMPKFQYVCCQQGNDNAKEQVDELIRSYYVRISKESPVRRLTEKFNQIMEGKTDVAFDDFTSPEMLELSKIFNRYYKQAEQLAYSDRVFNVGNRLKFFRDVNMLISYDKKRVFSLYCLDVCRFSQYNELFSVDVGDEILLEVRHRLSRLFGSYLYRINGDVFLGISLSDEDMGYITNRLLQLFENPVTVKNLSFPLKVRITACQYPLHGENPSVLIDRVQSALRFAKQEDQNIVIYNDTLDERIRTEADILHRLKDAITQQTLEIWYQPIMLLETGCYTVVEALVSLPDGKGGYFSAGQVVSLAERNGIVEQLGDYVLGHACSFMKAHGEELGLSRMGVNVSVQQLLVGDSAAHILDLIRSTDIDVDCITLEITESTLIQSIDQAAETLQTLRKEGIRIALDDFGVGYSSLNYLSNLPVDIIKIDHSLTRQILTNYKQHTLLKTLVEMASINDLIVVAEGVEKEEEQKVIAASGVQYIQGYYYARPMPEEELVRFLK